MITAFIAAHALVVQMLLASLGMGTALAAPLYDEFGNPLCITHVEGPTDNGDRDHSQALQCCTQACSTFTSLFAAPAPGNFLVNRLPVVATKIRIDAEAGFVKRPETEPGRPRGPPLDI
ncbi:hypothetical protein EDE05_10590 [Neorhizobium sp. R1-B]|uniref:hypothetical protein n=1 Tax=Neorhizobium sp. R1-B TaxID=2485162 RepID=UPI0010D4996E|nr:hypothetical protein [Neorhizobium sp. R1-B]TDX85065.1 hypothetical protein EDE05_10590 [Neorhizobium sp. R1-B]